MRTWIAGFSKSKTVWRSALLLLLLGSAALLYFESRPAPAPAPLIFAAASVKDALDAVLADYAVNGGPQVAVSYAGTPVLARQIAAGAPADLFLSADQEWMDHVEGLGLLVQGSRHDLLSNRLVLVSATVCGTDDGTIDRQRLERWLGASGRLAIAHPETVPAGRYGKSAMEHLGLWSVVAKRLVEVENVRIALKLAAMKEVPLALLYATDARTVPELQQCHLFDDRIHPPIRYPLAAIGPKLSPASAHLLDYLAAARAGQIWQAHGFGVIEAPERAGEGD